jgi:hypothetical protein
VQGIGIRGAGVGIAVKVADGNKRRAAVIVSVLNRCASSAHTRRSLAHWFDLVPAIGIVTARVSCCPGQNACRRQASQLPPITSSR